MALNTRKPTTDEIGVLMDFFLALDRIPVEDNKTSKLKYGYKKLMMDSKTGLLYPFSCNIKQALFWTGMTPFLGRADNCMGHGSDIAGASQVDKARVYEVYGDDRRKHIRFILPTLYPSWSVYSNPDYRGLGERLFSDEDIEYVLGSNGDRKKAESLRRLVPVIAIVRGENLSHEKKNLERLCKAYGIEIWKKSRDGGNAGHVHNFTILALCTDKKGISSFRKEAARIHSMIA